MTTAYIKNKNFEVIVHETYTDAQGVLVARVQYVGDLLGHIFEIEASRITVKAVPQPEAA